MAVRKTPHAAHIGPAFWYNYIDEVGTFFFEIWPRNRRKIGVFSIRTAVFALRLGFKAHLLTIENRRKNWHFFFKLGGWGGVPNFETMVFQCDNRCKFGILQAYSSHSQLSEACFREVLAFIVEKLLTKHWKKQGKKWPGKWLPSQKWLLGTIISSKKSVRDC